MRNRKNKKGFTLIELIIVIAIIGILAAVLIPTIGNAMKKANRTDAEAAIAGFKTAVATEEEKYISLNAAGVYELVASVKFKKYILTTTLPETSDPTESTIYFKLDGNVVTYVAVYDASNKLGFVEGEYGTDGKLIAFGAKGDHGTGDVIEWYSKLS